MEESSFGQIWNEVPVGPVTSELKGPITSCSTDKITAGEKETPFGITQEGKRAVCQSVAIMIFPEQTFGGPQNYLKA